MKKNRVLGILISFALMLTMMPVTGLSMPSYADNDAVYNITQTATPDNSGSMSVKVDGNDVTSAAAGATVELAALPAEGYALESVSATYDVIASVAGLVDVVGEARFECDVYYMIVSGDKLSIFTKDGGLLAGSAESISVEQDGSYYVKFSNFKDSYKISLDSNGRISSFSSIYYTFNKSEGYTKNASAEVRVRRSGNDWTFIMPAGKVAINAKFTEASNYPLWVGGTRVTSTNAANITGGDTVTASYTPATTGSNPKPAKLTLNGYSYTGDGYKGAAIYAKEDLTIVLKGNNSIESTDTTQGEESYGINLAVNDYIAFDLTISGSGTLITGGDYQEDGIYAGCITVDSGTVSVFGNLLGIVAQGAKNETGDYSGGNITINGGTVNVSNLSDNNAGILASGDITINDGNVNAASTGESGAGIYAFGDITIKGDSVTAEGKGSTGNCYGIHSGGCTTIEAGEVTATGTTAAFSGNVKNSITGTGWDNAAGSGDGTSIDISESGRELVGYKKVQFQSDLGPVSYLTWDENKKDLVEKTRNVYELVTDSTKKLENGKWYVVNADNLQIDDRITVEGTAHLILRDNKSLTAYEGIGVASGNTLNIYAQSTGYNAGKLFSGINELECYAGIGGQNSAAVGTITINGGRITACGNKLAAGIGGGISEAGAGTITINGGSVTATGGDGAAGIGGGAIRSGGTVTINGGSVEATGGKQGAGIGGGQAGSGGVVTINGGSVAATGGNEAAGIGGGGDEGMETGAAGGEVTINGGNVTATGKNDAAGIGGGKKGAGGTVVINGGSVTAACGSSGRAAIGSGRGSSTAGTVTLGTGITVKAGDSESDSAIIKASSYEDTHNHLMWAQMHTHGFTYSVSDATITATCANTDGHCPLTDNKASFTLIAPELKTYGGTGSAAAALDGVGDFNSATGKSISTSDIEYYKGETKLDKAPVDAGSYKAKITVEEKTAEVGYQIAKASTEITTAPAASAITYGQTLSDSTLSGGVAKSGDTVVPGEFSFEYGSTTPSVADSGTSYKVVFTPTDAANYNTAEVQVAVTVNKAAPAVTEPKAKSLTENGSAQELVTAGTAEGGAMTYSLGDDASTAPADGWAASIPAGTAAGTYYVWYKVTGDDNHSNFGPRCVTVTIAKKPSPKPTPTPAPAPAPPASTAAINAGTVNADTLSAAIAQAGGTSDSVTVIVLGSGVKKISKNTFAGFPNVRTLIVQTKKLKKSSVKKSLKGSQVSAVKVEIGNKKTNKKYVKKYKKIFTKKNAGKKAKVSL